MNIELGYYSISSVLLFTDKFYVVCYWLCVQIVVSNNINQPHPNTLSVHRRRRLTRPSLPLQRQRNWRNENQIRSKEFNKKYRIYHYKCCFPKCNNHDGIPNITCHEIPAPNDQNVKPMPDEVTTRIRTVENWHCKEMRHEIVLNRLNIKVELKV